MPYNFSELVKTVDFEPREVYEPRNTEPINFRVEIFSRGPEQFFARVYRRETFRIQPRFQGESRQVSEMKEADVQIHVMDDFIDQGELEGKSADEVITKFMEAIDRIFR